MISSGKLEAARIRAIPSSPNSFIHGSAELPLFYVHVFTSKLARVTYIYIIIKEINKILYLYYKKKRKSELLIQIQVRCPLKRDSRVQKMKIRTRRA